MDAPPPGPDRSAPERMVLFRAGGERFAVPLEAVLEVVVPQPPFARVPRARPGVRGAMNLRGRVVAVVEFPALVGLPPDRLAPTQGHVLVLEGARRGLGLLVASVVGVEPIAAGGLPGPPELGSLARGVAQAGGRPVTVLDPIALEERATTLFQAR